MTHCWGASKDPCQNGIQIENTGRGRPPADSDACRDRVKRLAHNLSVKSVGVIRVDVGACNDTRNFRMSAMQPDALGFTFPSAGASVKRSHLWSCRTRPRPKRDPPWPSKLFLEPHPVDAERAKVHRRSYAPMQPTAGTNECWLQKNNKRLNCISSYLT